MKMHVVIIEFIFSLWRFLLGRHLLEFLLCLIIIIFQRTRLSLTIASAEPGEL